MKYRWTVMFETDLPTRDVFTIMADTFGSVLSFNAFPAPEVDGE